MINSILDFIYLFWVIGIFISLILYSIFASTFKLKWYEGLLIGIINLVILAVGAKLLYIIEQFNIVKAQGLGFNGFSLYGAIFIMPLAFYLNHLIFKRDYLEIGSLSIIPLIVMLGFYRLDCFKNGCCGGIIINGFKVPTQMIEAISCLFLAVIYYVLTFNLHYQKGECYLNFFLSYGLIRFILEFFRERDNLFSLISISHIWSLLSIGIGIGTIIYRRLNKKGVKNYV